MNDSSCPFCSLPPDSAFFDGEHVVGIWDAFPVADGHALLIPRRHVASWFDATLEEQAELLRATSAAKNEIETRFRPDGYNIGINVGGAAGQTVFHLHVHVIPRYSGDVPDPRGGVRHVIPSRGNYLAGTEPASRVGTGAGPNALVQGGGGDPLLPHLVALLDDASSVAIVAAFTMESGVRLIEEHLRDVLDRGGSVRIVTGDYLGVTEPQALLRLLDLQGDIQLRVFESRGVSFHPKAYVVTKRNGAGTAFVGSSNLSDSALRRGVEWNYRVVHSRDRAGFSEVVGAFRSLWDHPSAKELDAAWVHAYSTRRSVAPPRVAGVEPEPTGSPPAPHDVQLEALAALEESRAGGHAAGLVVLATGLGKTWLSAFDSNRDGFRRVLFIAHREEILTQAMRTFRAIRPDATLGLYTGSEKTPDADVLFASIQTLGRRQHLHRFDPRHFDYVVVDEFHHAAAQTYRRVIGYLEPKFLLGLTATPERTDGGDLLSLCGDNLVYRCDVAEGIRRGLLSPFEYYGVPDEVDYSNIPWRSTRFDEEKLTEAVATRSRADNALEQYRELGHTRTVAFCVSRRHADFMASHFREAGVRSVAVHSGDTSAPRAHSLERLNDGELDVVFAVDMFNEGVDLPRVDTILMLRPTESSIVWLQQFGRGLRFQAGKTLRVIDYIGNHRVFLTKAKALFSLIDADRGVADTLARLSSGIQELPPGCSVTYQLRAVEILRGLTRPAPQGDQLRAYYEDFRMLHGARPFATEVLEDGLDPGSARRSGYRSWIDFVHRMEDLSPEQAEVLQRRGDFLRQVEVTRMVRSYKMLVLLAMLDADGLPGSISIDELTRRFGQLARRSAALRADVGPALDDPASLRQLLVRNPIDAWVGGRGTAGTSYFSYADGRLSTTFSVTDELRDAFQDLTRELAEWRLAAYTKELGGRPGAGGRLSDRIVCRVIQASGRPFLKLPDREEHLGIPEGWTELVADGEQFQAKFVKIALNVVVRTGSDENVLPDILRGWFGPAAGMPGRRHGVVLERRGEAYVMSPVSGGATVPGPSLWQRYDRRQAASAIGLRLADAELRSEFALRPDALLLFVTLDLESSEEPGRPINRFPSPDELQWRSPAGVTQGSELGQAIRHHQERRIPVHLFVRAQQRANARTAPFLYGGTLEFQEWQGEKPITARWRLRDPVPQRLWGDLGIDAGAGG